MSHHDSITQSLARGGFRQRGQRPNDVPPVYEIPRNQLPPFQLPSGFQATEKLTKARRRKARKA
jgi:hypothetical protein